MALAHTVGNKVEAAYRRGDMFEKRQRIMEDWAAYCGTISKDNTIAGLETMLTQSSGIDPTEASLQEALTRHFGGKADATVEAAKATLAKMPEQSRQWALEAAGQLDASGVAWFVGRLASVHRATAQKS